MTGLGCILNPGELSGFSQSSESKVEGTFYSANAGKEIGDSVRFQELKEWVPSGRWLSFHRRESNTRRNSMEGEVHRSSVGSNEEEEREWTTIEPESIVDFEESPTTNEVSIAVERLQRLPNIEGERHYLKIAFPTRVMKEEFVELLHKLYMRRIDQAEQEVDSLQETYGVKTTCEEEADVSQTLSPFSQKRSPRRRPLPRSRWICQPYSCRCGLAIGGRREVSCVSTR